MVGDGDSLMLSPGVGVAFFFRLCGFGVGVGVGLEKSFLILSSRYSSCSPRASADTLIRMLREIASNTRTVIFIRRSGGGQLLEHSLIHSNTGVEILQRKILIRRMRAAIGQGQSAQQCFRAENVPEIRHDRNAATFAN